LGIAAFVRIQFGARVERQGIPNDDHGVLMRKLSALIACDLQTIGTISKWPLKAALAAGRTHNRKCHATALREESPAH
jgi:hypothetical protein